MTQEMQSYEVEKMVSTLDKYENGLYKLYKVLHSFDEKLVDQLTDEQRDRFANNLANYAQELMQIAELIDYEVAMEYQ